MRAYSPHFGTRLSSITHELVSFPGPILACVSDPRTSCKASMFYLKNSSKYDCLHHTHTIMHSAILTNWTVQCDPLSHVEGLDIRQFVPYSMQQKVGRSMCGNVARSNTSSSCQPVCSGVPGLDTGVHTTEHLGTAVVGVPRKSGVDCVAPPFQS